MGVSFARHSRKTFSRFPHPVQSITGAIPRIRGKTTFWVGCAVFAGQESAAQWRIGEHGDVLIQRHRQQLDLGLSLDQIVHGLDRIDPCSNVVRDGLRFHDLPGRKIREPDIEDAAFVLFGFEPA